MAGVVVVGGVVVVAGVVVVVVSVHEQLWGGDLWVYGQPLV